MARPERDDRWFAMAAVVATGATCPRASVGAVLVKFDRVIACGYNGAPEREPHCPDTPEHLALEHCPRARHAEVNALRNALLPPFGATLYVVGDRQVCVNCEQDLRLAGVKDVRWRRPERVIRPLEAVVAEILCWQAATFPSATPASIAEHLRREAEELAAAPTSGAELADVLFLAFGLANTLGLEPAEILARKLAVNRGRRWGPPDAAGVSEHVREEVTP